MRGEMSVTASPATISVTGLFPIPINVTGLFPSHINVTGLQDTDVTSDEYLN